MAHAIPASEVHVWALRPSAVTDPALLAAYRDLLSPVERVRHARFTFEAGRLEFLLTRALVRTVLARYVGRPVRELSFTDSARGRPELDESEGIRFNLSHTSGLIVCAVTRDADVGIDVESLGRRIDLLEVASSVFSRDEFDGLRALPVADHRERFFSIWTLKEAYLKARGLGLALPLGAFTFSLGDSTSVRFDPPLVDDASAWQFELRRPTPDHLAALAVKRGDGGARRIQWYETIPLVTPEIGAGALSPEMAC